MDTGKLFAKAEMKRVRDSFELLDHDYTGEPRLFFENAGGSIRLKEAERRFFEVLLQRP